MFRFDGDHFQTAGSSKFSHRQTRGMGNYKNKALTTGCNEDYSCGIKTELMDMKTLNPYWQITETKSENREITHRVSRKQNPEKFLKS